MKLSCSESKEHNGLSLVLSYYGAIFVGLPCKADGLSQNIVTSPQEERSRCHTIQCCAPG